MEVQVLSRAPNVTCSEMTAPRGEYASNPERRNTPCISVLAGVKFLLKKERVFFFRGYALQVFGQVTGLMRTKFCENYFLEKGFRKTSTDLFLNSEFGCRKRRRRGLGRNSPLAPLISFGEILDKIAFLFIIMYDTPSLGTR